MAAFPEAHELATVETGDKAVSFQLSQSDILWTARAAAREAAREAQITPWVFVQRHVMHLLKDIDITYEKTLRSFSQPINPIWARDGSMCKPGGTYHGKPDCSEDKLKARDWYTKATWAQLDQRHPEVTATVALWARGKLMNPVPRVTNFAAPKVASNFLKKNDNAKLFYKGDNWYIIDPIAVSWPDSYVRMVAPDGSVATAAPLKPQTVFAAIMKGVTEWWRV